MQSVQVQTVSKLQDDNDYARGSEGSRSVISVSLPVSRSRRLPSLTVLGILEEVELNYKQTNRHSSGRGDRMIHTVNHGGYVWVIEVETDGFHRLGMIR